MAVTTELVFQGLLLSSVFLMVLGFPKIVILTLWSRWRIWTYDNLDRLKGRLGRWLTEDQLKAMNTPEVLRKQLADELSNYLAEVKKPLIESFSAAFFILLAKWNLDMTSSASSLLDVLVVIIVIVAIVVAVYVVWCSVKLEVVKQPLSPP
jgi:hypothetical protein